MSTSRKFSKGLGWGVIDNFSGTGINFIVGILLARALSPEAYSVIGLSLILVTISNIIADGGISTALIRKSKVSPADYNTGFFLNTLTAVIVYGILFLCAPLCSKFRASHSHRYCPMVRAHRHHCSLLHYPESPADQSP